MTSLLEAHEFRPAAASFDSAPFSLTTFKKTSGGNDATALPSPAKANFEPVINSANTANEL